MDIQSILVYLIFFACVICAIKWFIARVSKKKSGGCNCGFDCGCGCSGCETNEKSIEESNCCCNKEKN